VARRGPHRSAESVAASRRRRLRLRGPIAAVCVCRPPRVLLGTRPASRQAWGRCCHSSAGGSAAAYAALAACADPAVSGTPPPGQLLGCNGKHVDRGLVHCRARWRSALDPCHHD
jgi:hypothetical protein